MIYRFVENPFASLRLSDNQYALFTKSHLEALVSANTNAQYKNMIDTLTPKYQAFDSWLNKQDQNTSHRKGKTQTLNGIQAEFIQFVKKEVYKEVSYKWERGNKEVFHEFFPKGLSEYNKITKKNASVLFDRIKTATAKYKADLPTGLSEKAAQLDQEFDQLFSGQLQSKASVKDGSAEGQLLREQVSEVLYVNLIDQLRLHIQNPKQVLALYDSKVLNVNKSKSRAEEPMAV